MIPARLRLCLGLIAATLGFGCLNAALATADTDCLGNTVAGFGISAGCFDGSVDKDPADPTFDPLEPASWAFTQAAGKPYQALTSFDFNTRENPDAFPPNDWPSEPIKDVLVDLPPGLIGNPRAVEECTLTELAGDPDVNGLPTCPVGSQVGNYTFRVNLRLAFPLGSDAVFNMPPPPGVPARFGFNVYGTIVVLDAELHSDDYSISVDSRYISEGLPLTGFTLSFWGVPADPGHDANRRCVVGRFSVPGPSPHLEPCASPLAPSAFLRLPTSCTEPGEGLTATLRTDSWADPGDFKQVSFESHLPPGHVSNPFSDPSTWGTEQGPTGCRLVTFEPEISVLPTADSAETPTGLEVELTAPQEALVHPTAIASADLESAKVTLPAGMTVNPSVAEGLSVCTPADYAREEKFSSAGEGCPNGSRIGSVEVISPLLEEKVFGHLYLAQQDDPLTGQPGAENPFDSMLALYIVARNKERGVLVKLAGKVEPNEEEGPNAGRLVTTFDRNPQLPFSSFKLKFREGGRAPLVTPPACGVYETDAEFVPWSAEDPEDPQPSEVVHVTSPFQITRGVGGGPCPGAGVPPFNPGFSAGSINPDAGAFTSFGMRLTRQDGEQNMTRFSAKLPPGVLGKLAGLSKCPDSAIAVAKAKTGRQELAAPSCPANSRIGRVLVGAGVGSVLTYVPGSIYLGGALGKAPLSVIVITPAVAGPFDVGTVVVKEALTLDPRTAEVQVDSASSEPIPHVLKGIPLKLRDLRVYVDRQNFILNPTNCTRSRVEAILFGSYLDLFSAADDLPVTLRDRFQAANCANLGFKPRLSLALRGGTKRGDFPALRAVLRARAGDANIGAATVTLPRSAFLEQSHIRTICTRVQYAADNCPKAAQYGYARAFTPLLDEPIEGPVYLRSSNNKLPDLVAALQGLVDVEVSGRIDSFKGGIRSSFDSVPDAPVSKFVLTMQGGRKGLVVNSANLCASKNRAKVRFVGQNGKLHSFKPLVRARCGGKGRKGKR